MAADRTPLFSRLQRAAGGMLGRPPLGHPQMPLRMFLKGTGAMVARTGKEEMSCDECFAELDRLVERVAGGGDINALGPLVADHLRRCGDCYEEYAVLLHIARTD